MHRRIGLLALLLGYD